MSADIDYYDVQGMIRDARSEIRGEIDTAVSDLRTAIGREMQLLHEEIVTLGRLVASRTEHLA